MTDRDGWDRETSPHHPGEQELHERLGVRARQEAIGRRMVRPYLPEQHREFYATLPFLVVGSVDEQERLWASMLFGLPGFVTTPDDRSVRIEGGVVTGDMLSSNLSVRSPLGMLGIELPTRRRNRVNGVVARAGDHGFDMKVVQSFGNCPMYIQTRDMHYVRDPREAHSPEVQAFSEIDDVLATFLRNADTFFVASANLRDDIHDRGGVDVNHRGGQPGFIAVDGNTLTIPDFRGNNAFNTLGNFLVHPRAGLLFVDWECGDLIQLTGRAELLWDGTDESRALEGAKRAWRFELEQGQRLVGASPLRFEFGEFSPMSLATGTWKTAEESLRDEF